MEGALEMVEKILSWIFGIVGSILSAFVMYQYTSTEAFKRETRSEIAGIKKESLEKFVLRADCQRASDLLHNENRQDHQLMFDEIKELRAEMMKTQTMILQELRK